MSFNHLLNDVLDTLSSGLELCQSCLPDTLQTHGRYTQISNHYPKELDISGATYQIQRILGDGGFSQVVLATRKDNDDGGQLFAIKIMYCPEPDRLEMARNEIDAYHRLSSNHTNIIRLIRSLISQNNAYMVFPYYPEGNLFEVAEHDWEEPQIINILRGICKALEHIHGQGYVHGDLKLANVMLNREAPVLMDLGSVREARIHVETRAQALRLQDDAAERCTMPYRAPELFQVDRGDDLDERTDIWSLGCLLYAMAFHHTPFEGDQIGSPGDSIALAAMNRKFSYPATHPYSNRLIQLIDFMMEPYPLKRPYIAQVIELINQLYEN